jgi:hypothetical protein
MTLALWLLCCWLAVNVVLDPAQVSQAVQPIIPWPQHACTWERKRVCCGLLGDSAHQWPARETLPPRRLLHAPGHGFLSTGHRQRDRSSP